ncbi:FAD-dependent oxidoreductase [Methylomagnum sp.]
MTSFNRREFLKLTGAASLAATLPTGSKLAKAGPIPKVLVIGGGFGGATVAKYLRLWSNRSVDVTLVDPRAGVTTGDGHYSCILSNLVVTGQLGLSRVLIGYSNLKNVHGVNLVKGSAIGLDPVGRKVAVSLAGGGTQELPYDHVVLSPGIDFIAPPGSWDANLTPHAWQAGPQTTLLKTQLSAMTSKGTFIMTIPKSPYRCPPGPYERACVVANYLKAKRSGAKLIVLDENPSIQAEPVAFGNAFAQRYAGVLTYYTNVVINSVDSGQKRIDTNVGAWDKTNANGKGKVECLNIIPRQKAGKIVFDAGLPLDAPGRWAKIDPLTYASTGFPDVHIIGDAQASAVPTPAPNPMPAAQPKSGSMANSQAKVCADAILRALNGEMPDPQPTTNSACYSPIDDKTASWLTAGYQYDPTLGMMVRVAESFGEAPNVSGDNYEDMYAWADNIFADSFK